MLKEKTAKTKNEKITFSPMKIAGYPKRKNIVGTAGKFIDEFSSAIKSEYLYHVMGVAPDKSFLITGPPGNGKTFSVEALVNEINESSTDSQNLDKINLLGFKYDIGEYGTKFINEGCTIVQKFFDNCLEMANDYRKTIMIFDEADVLFGKRDSQQSHKEDSKVLTTIMKNMEKSHNMNNVYTILLSNFPDAFDKASIRAGRIDKKYIFNIPTQSEREFAYNHAIQQINEKATYNIIQNYDASRLAEMSDKFSYADITESVRSAVKQKIKELYETEINELTKIRSIKQNRLEKAVQSHGKNFIKTKKPIGFTTY